MKKMIALLLALIMVFSLVACSGSADTAKDTTTTDSTTTDTADTTGSDTTAEPASTEGSVINVCLASEPDTIDPALNSAVDGATMLAHLFSGLAKWSQDADGNLQIIADAATELPEGVENEDGTVTYTFRLRGGKWSDGVEVKASDFVYAWQRLADPATASPNAALLEMVAGYRQVRSSGDVSKLQVSAPEENTFVVTLSNRCAYFLSAVCTAAATMPVRSEQPKNWQADPTALCTNGAYRISEWKNGLLTATVPESYYDQRRLQMSTLVFRFETDAAMRTELLKKNEVDFVLGLSQEELADEPETWTPDSYPQVMTLLVNQMAQSLASEELRQAMSLVIDRNALAALTESRLVTLATGLIPGGIRNTMGGDFRTESGDLMNNDPEALTAAREKAAELMQQAGLTDPSSLAGLGQVTLLYEENDINAKLAQLLRDTWRDQLGLVVTLKGVTGEEVQRDVASGEFTIAMVTLKSDRNDAMGLLRQWASGSKEGEFFYSHAYDMLMGVAADCGEVEVRDAYLEDAERLLLETGYVCPLYFTGQSSRLSSAYTGLLTDGIGGYYFSYVVQQNNG